MKRKRINYKWLITDKLSRISKVTGETYVLDYNRSRGGYKVFAKDTKVSYNYPPKRLLCYRASARVLYKYLEGVLWGMGVNGSLIDKKIDYLRFIEKIDEETRMVLKKELAELTYLIAKI